MAYVHPGDRELRAGIRKNDPNSMRELARALRIADGNIALAASVLNCSHRTLRAMAADCDHVAEMVQGGWQK